MSTVTKLILTGCFSALIALPALGSSSKITYAYDKYGNCTAVTTTAVSGSTETILEKSEYDYDNYRRPVSMMESAHTSSSRVWNWTYERYFAGNPNPYDPYAHTSRQWRLQYEPAYDAAGNRHVTARFFDANDRVADEYTGMIDKPGIGLATTDDFEGHHFTYDENGQKKTFTDPRGRVTDYTYDLRNRLRDTIEPKRADQATRPTTTIDYDFAGNKTDVTFPDTRSQHWRDYDAFGQARQFIDERNNITDLTYIWGPMKKLYKVKTYRDKDGGETEEQLTTFSYDWLGRPTAIAFPDGTSEVSTYKFGQLETFKTRKGQLKTISYDARGRETCQQWDALAATPGISRIWDDANRLKKLSNIYSTIEYGYDGAGLVQSETNIIAGAVSVVTTFARYPSGAVSQIKYPYGGYFRRDYNSRGQLGATGSSDGNGNWLSQFVNYHYHRDGKVNWQSYGNGVQTIFDYDLRGMIKSVDHQRNSGQEHLSWREYTRDNRDRIISFRKGTSGPNPMENGRGDRFRYDEEGQLLEAWYNAADPANSGAGNSRYDGFIYDQLGNRKQDNFLARWGVTTFGRRDNGLNQYLHWSGTPVNHQENGAIIQDGWIDATYNALNQPISMSSPNSGGIMWFGYDPLGRCVKRWTGPSGDAASNPATYYYYDGWNLIQEGPSATSVGRRYLHGTRVDEIVTSWNSAGEQAYHHYDARGHATLLTNSSGGILEQYEYDAFGQPYVFAPNGDARTESQFGNRFLFTGREWLKDLWIYDYRNRMYQPELGRFLQPDPKHFEAGDYNLYRYCHNDPVNKADPTGLYITYSENWSEADAEIFKQGFKEMWDNPSQRAQLERMYASDKEYRVFPDRSSGTAAEGATRFHFVENATPQQPSSFLQRLSDAVRNIPKTIGMAQGNQNFEKKPQGDNTAANTRAEAAARKEGLSDTQREIFHDAIHNRKLNFQQLREEARLIKETYPNK